MKFWKWGYESGFFFFIGILLLVGVFAWGMIYEPEDRWRETQNYEQLLEWNEIPELKADISAAWANGWISRHENKAIVRKHGNLDEMRAKKKFESQMTEQRNKAWEATNED